MNEWFELWDSDNASLVGTYEAQAAALAVVWRTIDVEGEAAVMSLVLTRERDGDEPEVIASGEGLARLAVQSASVLAP